MIDIVSRLLDDAKDHEDVANNMDMPPEFTRNYHHAVNAKEAAFEILKLRQRINELLMYVQKATVLEIASINNKTEEK